MQKKVQIGIILALIFFSVILVLALTNSGNEGLTELRNSNIVYEKEVTLSDEDRKTYEDRIAKAEQDYNGAENDEQKFNALMNKGQALLSLGKFEDAQKSFEEASAIFPNDPRSFKALFEVKVEMMDYAGAEVSAREAIDLVPEAPDMWIRYIEFKRDKAGADNGSVFSLYSEAIVRTNNNIDIITAYASWLEQSGNLLASKEYWQKAVEINPSRKSIYDQEIKKIDQKLNF